MPIKVRSKKEDKRRFLNIFNSNFLLVDILSKVDDIKSLFWYVINLFIIAKLAKEKWNKKLILEF